MLKISIQRATRHAHAPTAIQLKRWAKEALRETHVSAAELTIRIVSEKEMAALNSTYRKKSGTTNVLSFPFDLPAHDSAELPLLGDIVICAAVIAREAVEQHKTTEAHWAHMVVHGTLHLLGHDHIKDAEAEIMETLEINILKSLGFHNPYNIKNLQR